MMQCDNKDNKDHKDNKDNKDNKDSEMRTTSSAYGPISVNLG